MFCKYSKKSTELDNIGWNRLYCNITNEMCNCQYRCAKINNWRNYDNLDKRCITYKHEGDKEYMTQGNYRVLYEKRGRLYVELDHNTSITVLNPFGSDVPKGVDLVNIKDTYYIKGYEPKIEIKPVSGNTNKKNKTSIKD